MFRAGTIIAAVTTACAALSLSTALAAETCDHFEELLTTTPAPPHTAGPWKLYYQKLAAIQPGNYDLLLIGDSLADAWPADSLSPLQVANFGIGGDETQNVLWRLASPELAKLKPRKVLVVIGTNNLGAGNPPCATVAGINKIIEKVRETWPSAQIAFLEIPPRGTAGFKFNNDWRLETNAAVGHIKGVTTINVDNAITCNWHVPCENYADDNSHFSQAGYQILGKAVKAALFQN